MVLPKQDANGMGKLATPETRGAKDVSLRRSVTRTPGDDRRENKQYGGDGTMDLSRVHITEFSSRDCYKLINEL
ncbi:unnamed protein product [Cylindrotheca closterium]|uniref:Uncharacterized protein n=1 Tax=Cylindrotheca closterium TaxID=2856 RepID=A0AAD2FSD3_9STRA|nr:unnamed protein product [Cylindrotheca closterium]